MEHLSGSQAPGLTHKNYTELGRYVKDKHSSLFELFSKEKEKKCVSSTPGPNVIKLFCPLFTSFHNKLECLSLASFYNLV